MKKRIGISYTEASFQNYWDWFTQDELGEEIELIELSFLKGNVEDFDVCDGFVMTGGIDVLPEIYGEKDDYPHRPKAFLPERDKFEQQVYVYSQQHQIPLLGICRGMQYINILEGGKVFQDNGEAINLVHKKGTEDRQHEVNVVKDSLLYAITETEQGTVNSAHHQCVDPDHLGLNLKVAAYSNTQEPLIEALEFADQTDKGFMIAVQWHPERILNKESNPLSQKIKENFIQAVKAYQK